MAAAWFNPEDPHAYSGVPAGVVTELRRLGVYAGSRNVTPWTTPSKLIHRWTMRTRLDSCWTLAPGMRGLSRLNDGVRRLTTPNYADGWVQIVGGYGQALRGRYVTLFDMSPSQLVALSRWAPSFGYPSATPAQIEWVARRQAGAYRHAYGCCVPSRWAADSLIREHDIDASRVHVIGYGRNADLDPPPDRDWTTPRFLFVGRDWHRKNGDAVVRAFLRLRRKVPAAHLDLVGEHPPIRIDGVTGHGLVAGLEPGGRELLRRLFATATCFVMPSWAEPFGIVYIEAAAAGVPSVATSIGGTADSVGDGGILVDPADDEAIWRAMVTLSDPETAFQLGQRARDRTPAFSWGAVGQRVLRSLDLGPIPGIELAEPL